MNKDIIYWKKGDVIYDIGDNPEAAFIINSGQVEIKSSEGIKVGIIKENEIFGDKACILGLKRSVKAIAFIDTSAIVVSRNVLLDAIKDTPLIIKAILRSTYLRLDGANLINEKIKDLKSSLS